MALMLSCATLPEQPHAPAPVDEAQTSGEEEAIVKKVQEEATLDKLVNRLYDTAYEFYLAGNYENAITNFEVAEILNPEKMEFWKKLALSYCYLATGRYPDAQKLSSALMDQKSEYWGAYFNAGLAALWQNKLQRAVKYLEMADEFDAHEPVVNLYLGIAYDLMKRKKNASHQFLTAEQAYGDIISNNPGEEQAYIELAYLYLYLDKNFDKVLSLIKQAETIIQESDDLEKRRIWIDFYLPHLKGIYFYKRGEFRQSILTLGGAIEKAPSGIRLDLAESYYYLGKNYQALKDLEKGRQFFQKALSIDALVLHAQEIHSFLYPKGISGKKTRKKGS